jgi:predicted NBD/HSP70 family sugar kinase
MASAVKTSAGDSPGSRLAIARVFRALSTASPLSRGELRRLVALSPSTVTDAVTSLLERDYVREAGRASSTGGRPAGLLEVSPSLGGVLAADIGGLRMRIAAADVAGRILARKVLPTPGNAADLRAALLSALAEVRAEVVGPSRTLCLSIAGVVNPATGEISATDNVASWSEAKAPDWLRDQAEVLLTENEANMAAFGEYHRGAARGTQIVMLVALGAGIGAGLMVGGQLYRGATGAAGEIGLSRTSADPAARDLERMVAGPALTIAYRERTGRELGNPAELFRLAAEGDAAAAAVVEAALDQLAVVLTNALLVVNPERVIIGGGLATAGDLLLEPLRRRIGTLLMTSLPDFVLSELGPDAALAGAITRASHLALERLAAELDTVPVPGAGAF